MKSSLKSTLTSALLSTIMLSGFVFTGIVLNGCSSMQGTRQDYFGYRNSVPPSEGQAQEEQQAEAGWQNPTQTTPRAVYVPVISPWYDASMYGGYASYAALSRYGWSSWGLMGSSIGFGFGYSPSYYWGSSFGFGSLGWGYSSPYYSYNPYWGSYYNPYRGYSVVNVYNNNYDTPAQRQSRFRDFGVQRPYATTNYDATSVGTFTSDGAGGARSRTGTTLTNKAVNLGSGGTNIYSSPSNANTGGRSWNGSSFGTSTGSSSAKSSWGGGSSSSSRGSSSTGSSSHSSSSGRSGGGRSR